MFERFRAFFRRSPEAAALPSVAVSSLLGASYRHAYDDGSKFAGGFGETILYTADYWTLRARSSQLFETNLYARGLLRRLVTNEINTGLHLESSPEELILGVEEDSLSDWSENIENRFHIWEKEPRLCDHAERATFGAIQAQARLEALIAGDVLVVLLQDPVTQLPRVHLVNGAAVQAPIDAKPSVGNRIVHGVELDARERHVAYWVVQKDGTSARMPAFGEKTGRRVAWLMYGTDKRLDDVRGKPILALVLQSLREIDRYRDSVQRKAVINSMVAMFIKKEQDRPGSNPLGAMGATLRGLEGTVEPDGKKRSFQVVEQIPGVVIDELQFGETPHAHPSTGTDEKFGTFEEAIIQAVAWANETPPEILRLAFSSNYSASQAAINEFKMYLNVARTRFGDAFCHPIFVEWLLSETLTQKIQVPGLLDAWRDPAQYDVYGAWTSADWSGHIKPAVDLSKLVKGYAEMIALGMITRDRASRELTGTKFTKNAKKLRRENELIAHANEPLKVLEAPPSAPPPPDPPEDADEDDEIKKAS